MISLLSHTESAATLFLRRLQSYVGVPLTTAGAAIDLEASRQAVAAGDAVLRPEGSDARILASGVACEQRVLDDGRRQILGLRLPGDVLMEEERGLVVALTPLEVADARPVLRLLGETGPAHLPLRRAWVAAARADQALQRDQIVRLGRLSAAERMAHLLTEVHERLLRVGLASASTFHLPVRQELLADLLGMSIVHVSRVTQQLRRDRMVEIRSNYVSLLDRERLGRFAGSARGNSAPRPPTIAASGAPWGLIPGRHAAAPPV
ncbi:MAG: Crp/Fnr family transcriptional regulator [Phenylobacterium zucineum]|nr:MAG: Crp/Fnr family transcriptional regulator [Phenylobacterium zucineum]